MQHLVVWAQSRPTRFADMPKDKVEPGQLSLAPALCLMLTA